VLIAREDRVFPADFQRRVAADRLGITPDEIDGGHCVALSHPKQLADRLTAYLRPGALMDQGSNNGTQPSGEPDEGGPP
jgi:hypothetical protein